MNFFGPITTAEYIARPNRFIVQACINGQLLATYMPNPGRLQELLLPGAKLYLEKNKPQAKQAYTVVGVEHQGFPVMLHTHRNNDVAQWLLEEKKVPGLETAEIIQREKTIGHSRYDFLLKMKKKEIVLEVKSCTLFGKQLAMFPDAVTERGKRHVEGLAQLPKDSQKGHLLFLVHTHQCEYFLPEFHTDYQFARTLYAYRDQLTIQALAVKWHQPLSLDPKIKQLTIPWPAMKGIEENKGNYLIVLYNARNQQLTIGGLGLIVFQPGYYLYVGSAQNNLTARIRRHQRLKKKKHWHIDYLRAYTKFIGAWPIRNTKNQECDLANKLTKIADGSIKGFGASDCECFSHLLLFKNHPLQQAAFHEVLQYFRMDRFVESPIKKVDARD